MSEREWLVLAAKAKGYRPTDDDTDSDLVWVIRNYRRNISWPSRRYPHARPVADRSTRGLQFTNTCENPNGMLAVLG